MITLFVDLDGFALVGGFVCRESRVGEVANVCLLDLPRLEVDVGPSEVTDWLITGAGTVFGSVA